MKGKLARLRARAERAAEEWQYLWCSILHETPVLRAARRREAMRYRRALRALRAEAKWKGVKE